MEKKEFKALFIAELTAKGKELDPKRIESALEKTARHATAKYGRADWKLEFDESGIYNAINFYHEYMNKNTFNRDRYQSERNNGIYRGC